MLLCIPSTGVSLFGRRSALERRALFANNCSPPNALCFPNGFTPVITQYIDIMFKRNLNRSISFVIMYYVTFLRSLRVVVGLGACAHDFVKMDVMFSFHAPNICIMYTPVAKLNYLHSCTRTCTCTRTHVYQFRSPVILIFP